MRAFPIVLLAFTLTGAVQAQQAPKEDRDNRLNRREWTGSAVRFHRLDANQDGVLSPRELSRNQRLR